MATTTRLYTDQILHCSETLKLENKTSHHLIKVLRTKIGSQLIIFNGDGFDYAATLTDIKSKNIALLSIAEKTKIDNESPLNLTLLQGISRGNRMETTIQKSVELGINEIIPIVCTRSNYTIRPERIQKKIEHWKQIITSACEQSGRSKIPRLSDIMAFSDAIKLYDDKLKIVLSTDADQSIRSLQSSNKNVCVCIGPEGGLTPEEVSQAKNNSYQDIKFGPRILRTETAGPAVISALQTIRGDF